jgi:hypothetical protein
VFTPYKNAWLKKLDAFFLRAYPVARHAGALAPRPPGMGGVPTLADIGFEPTNLHQLKLPSGPSVRRNCWTTSCCASTATPTRATFRRQGAQLPQHPPALRHGVHPPAGARGHAAHGRPGRAAPRCGCRS